MIQQFINRRDELAFLEKKYSSKKPELIVLYGRRRIGKTELVLKFSEKKQFIYFLADKRPDKENLNELKEKIGEFFKDELFKKASFKDWVDLLSEFAKKANRRIILIIDEFPYLIEGNKAIPSLFQKAWDNHLSKKKIMLILLGSSISMMETEVLSYKSPLYGRRTGQWKVTPINVKYLRSFLPKYKTEDLIKVYSITDMIPLYLNKFQTEKPLTKNMIEQVFSKGSFLYEEAEFLLREELREPRNYFAILKSIAEGNHRIGLIVNNTGLEKSLVSKYIDTLCNIHILKKVKPVTESNFKARNTLYKFEDKYFEFWFKFVYPNKDYIEQGLGKELIRDIEKKFSQHVSIAFEDFCMKLIPSLSLPFKPSKIGKWWHKENEIDLIALNENTKEILFGECKWKEKTNASKVIKELIEKSEKVKWHDDERKEYYAVFAKSFKKKIKEYKGKRVFCFDLKDIEKTMK